MNAIRRAEVCPSNLSDPAIESSVAYLDWDRCKLQLSHLASCVIQMGSTRVEDMLDLMLCK